MHRARGWVALAAVFLFSGSVCAANATHGESLYNTYCATCHNPGANPGPDFIVAGANNPAYLAAALQVVPEMQPFAPLLKSSDIDDIAAYLAVRFGAPPPPPPPPPPLSPSVSALPATLDFGSVDVGKASAAMTVTFENSGGAAATGLVFTNSKANAFAVSANTCGAALSGGASCAVSLSFAPVASGKDGATLTLAYTEGSVSVAVSGVGIASAAPPIGLAAAIVYHHAAFDHYFITSIADEIVKLDNGTFAGWTRTGRQVNVYSTPAAERKTVCRFFSTAFAPKSSHFYTPDSGECTTVKANPDWQFEGEVFFAISPALDGTCPAGTNPVYRMYNNGQGGAPNHRYTTDLGVRAAMLAAGWIAEGYGTLGVIMCAPG